MATCASCGRDNPSGTVNCQSCDQVLPLEEHLDLPWSLSARGTTASGSVLLVAPPGADLQRLRPLCEAAFSKALTELGSAPTAESLQTRMRDLLAELLPADHRVERLDVSDCRSPELATEAAEPAQDPTHVADGSSKESGIKVRWGGKPSRRYGEDDVDDESLTDVLFRWLVVTPVFFAGKVVATVISMPFAFLAHLAFGGEEDEGCCGCVVLFVALPIGTGVVIRLLA